MADETVKELWKIKDAIANEYVCDVKALVGRLRAKKHEEDKQVVGLRSIEQTETTVAASRNRFVKEAGVSPAYDAGCQARFYLL